jgi:antitoxin component YwqK of YwqJK toxin-antitoxin module
LSFLSCSFIFGQRLTLNDLISLCNKNNWDAVNQTLVAKGWEYYESEKGNSFNYNTIVWSYEKDYYSDEAQAWFSLYTYEGFPNKIFYNIFNTESYLMIQNSISSAGFKIVNSQIENNQVITTYSNAQYSLEIITEKLSENDWDDVSTTSYGIKLIKKASVYDSENGKKTDYYDDGTVKLEYSLSNGKLNGKFIHYYENGRIKTTGSFTNGLKNGVFKEYDESGGLETEYSMSNDMKNGILKIFSNGKVLNSITYKDDIRNGEYVEYVYNDETGILELKAIGNYLNDYKNGVWKLFYIEDDKSERLLTFENYINDVRSGQFQDVEGDSLILGYYKNGELHGKYKVYRDIARTIFGGVIRTDTSKLTLTVDGNYFEGLKSGYWKNYDFSNTLRSEGSFLQGKEFGEWKYYYTNWENDDSGTHPYSKQLYLVLNYSNGNLEGKSTRYSFLEEEFFPCEETEKNSISIDTCKRMVFQKVLEIGFYKNGKLNGPYELRDSLDVLIAKGNYKDDMKVGEWLHRINENGLNEEVVFSYQKGNYIKDKKEGKWIKYFTEGKVSDSFNYKNGYLHGEYISWNQFGNPNEKKQFSNGQLTELIIYDSLGVKQKHKYEIYDYNYSGFKCRNIEYFDDGYLSQEYSVKNEVEINHDLFQLAFMLAIANQPTVGITAYKDGDFKAFDLENRPIVTGRYYKEDMIGLWTFYFFGQEVKIESNFMNGKKSDEKYLKINGDLFSGEFIYNDDREGVIEERSIKNGLRNGKTVYVDAKTKKVIKKENFKNGELK